MSVNNTVTTKLFVIYPGDESLMIYNDYPYDPPKPIMINPESGIQWLKLKMVAKTPHWSPLIPEFTSKSLDKMVTEIVQNHAISTYVTLSCSMLQGKLCKKDE